MLWVNRPLPYSWGRYQWAEAELDLDYLEEHDIALLRRTSGEARSTMTSGISTSQR